MADLRTVLDRATALLRAGQWPEAIEVLAYHDCDAHAEGALLAAAALLRGNPSRALGHLELIGEEPCACTRPRTRRRAARPAHLRLVPAE